MTRTTVPVTASPPDRVRWGCDRWGEAELVRSCAAILRGGPTPDGDLLRCLGGMSAQTMTERGLDLVYWPAVWAARTLLYAWREEAAPAVVVALGNPAWRVREMAARVCALREVGAAADPLATLLADPVPRVRAAAARALGKVGEAEHAAGLRALAADEDPTVRGRGDQALRQLAERLDRPI
jgi:hypothetical protein